MDNARIARAFDELADLLELAGENPFKLRAYRNFAEAVRELSEPLSAIAKRGELAEMAGVGKAILGKVQEVLDTGTCAALEKARAKVPQALPDLLRVPGLSPKTVRVLWQQAEVTTLGELAYACEENRLAALPNFGRKKQAKTLAAVTAILEGTGSILLGVAREAGALVSRLLMAAGALEVAMVGDARRGVALVRELVVLVRGMSRTQIVAALAKAEPECQVLNPESWPEGGPESRPGLGETTHDVSVLIAPVRARLVIVDDATWVSALVTGIGDADHVRWLEDRATAHGGLLAVCTRAVDEAGVYRVLGLPLPPPELREGSVTEVPELVASVKGIFHCHSTWSDGNATIAEMADAAARFGFTYIGISDHSKAASYAHGLDANRLREQSDEIARARKEVPGITILHGVEVDILDDGALDLDDAALSALDFVIASVHSRLTMDSHAMTARIVRAVSHPLVTILGHPTGRLLLGRKGYSFDLIEVARAAAENDTYIEINANAHRLDLSDTMARLAATTGARFAINPDAHATRGVEDTPLGVVIARRAGLGSDRILNALSREDLVQALAKRKKLALSRLFSAV